MKRPFLGRLGFRAAVLCAGFLAAGCPGGDEDDGSAGGSAGSAGSSGAAGASGENINLSLSFACVDHATGGDIEYTATAPFSKTTKCQYTRDAQLLTVTLAGGTEYNVFFTVTGFTGAGIYTTTSDDTVNTAVTFDVWSHALDPSIEDGALAFGSWDPGYMRSFPCELEVSETDLADVVILGDEGTTGRLTMRVTCPALGGSALGRLDCQMTPQSFEFKIASCLAYKN